MNIKIEVYDKSVFEKDSIKVAEVEFFNIQHYEVKIISDKEIFEMGFDETDEFKEYLIITLENGEQSTFRNSRVNLFRI